MDTYRFTETSNDVVNIALLITNGPGVNPIVQVWDPAGNDVSQAVISGGRPPAYIRDLSLDKSSTYLIVVRDDELNEVFSYQLSYITVNGSNLREASDGPE